MAARVTKKDYQSALPITPGDVCHLLGKPAQTGSMSPDDWHEGWRSLGSWATPGLRFFFKLVTKKLYELLLGRKFVTMTASNFNLKIPLLTSSL